MGSFQILCLVLLSSGFAWSLKEPLGASHVQFTGDCQSNLPVGKDVEFTYEGTVLHQDTKGDTTGIRILCQKSVITLVQACAGRMKLKNCKLYDSGNDGSFSQAGSKAQKEARKLTRFPVYFHIQQGEVTKVFVAEREEDYQLNIKKAILSALSLNTHELPASGSEDTKITTSIFGKTQTTVAKDGKDVTTTRQLKSEMADSVLRIPGVNFDMITSRIQKYADQYLAPSAEQICNYKLTGANNVGSVSCTEKRVSTGSWVQATGMAQGVEDAMATTITQKLKLTKLSKAKGMLARGEIGAIKKNYVSDGLEYTNQLDQLDSMVQGSKDAFDDAVSIMNNLANGNDLDATAIGNLEIWMAKQDEETLEELMGATADNQHWGTVLKGCLNLKWCQGEQCSASPGCQKLLGNLLANQPDESVLQTLTSIESPTADLLGSTLDLADGSQTAENVLALGKVLNQFVKSGNGDGSQAQGFLVGVVNRGCRSASGDSSVLVSAIKSLAPLGLNLEQFSSCLQASHVSDDAKFALVQALNADSISNPQTRSALMNVMQDSTKKIKLRIACFVGLIMNDPSPREVNAMVQLAYDHSEPHLFTHCLKSFIEGQVALKDTTYKELPDSIISLIENSGSFSGESKTLKKHNYRHSISENIPKVNRQADVDINLDTYTEEGNLLPIIMDLTVVAEVAGFGRHEVLHLKVDTGRMLPVINALLESNEYIKPNAFNHLLKLPLKQVVSYLFENKGSLTDAVMNNLALLHEKFALVEEMNSMDRIPFFDLKIMGKRLTGARFASNGSPGYSVADALKMMALNENGYGASNLFSSVPFVYQQAVPTSIGTPLVTYVRLNSAAKAAAYWMMEAAKMYLDDEGSVHGSYDIKIDMDATLGQTSSIMREVGCGSAIKAQFEMVDSSDARLDTTPTSATFLLTLPEQSTITFRLQDIESPWASLTGNAVEITDDVCANTVDKNVYGVVNMHVCYGKFFPRQGTVGYATDGSTWKCNVDWAPRGDVKGFVFDFTQETDAGSTSMFAMNADYTEADRQLVFDAQVQGQSMFGFTSQVSSENDEDLKSSTFDLSINYMAREVISTTFTVSKSSGGGDDGGSWLGGLSCLWGCDDEEEEEEESSGPTYKFSGYLNYLEFELSIDGSMETPDELGQFNADLSIFVGPVLKVFQVDWQNKQVTVNGVQGTNVSIVFHDFDPTVITQFTSVGMYMVRVPGYDLERIVYYPTESDAYYVDVRNQLTGSNQFEFISTITCNFFQNQIHVNALSSEVFKITGYQLQPVTTFPFSDTGNLEDPDSTKYALNDPSVADVHGFTLTFTEEPEMTTQYSQIFHGKEIINFVQTYDKTCRSCSKSVVKTSNIDGQMDATITLDRAPEGVQFAAHVPPMVDLEASVNFVQTDNGVSLIGRFSAPILGNCQASATYEVVENTATGFRNVSCNSEYLGTWEQNFGMTYTFSEAHDYWAWDSSFVDPASIGIHEAASFDVTGQEKVMGNVETTRKMSITQNGREKFLNAALGLAYQSGSETDGNVAPYVINIGVRGSGQAPQSNQIDLYSRNPFVFEDYLTNVCGQNEGCRTRMIGKEKKKYAAAMVELENAFDSVNGKFDAMSGAAWTALSEGNGVLSTVLSKINLGQATFRSALPYWTVVPPALIRRSLPDVENKFAIVRDYLREKAELGPREAYEFDIAPLEAGMESALKGLYSARNAVDNLLRHPTDLAKNAAKAQRAFSNALSNVGPSYNTPRHHVVGFSPATATKTQFVGFDMNNRALPYGLPSHCAWVGAMDMSSGAINTFFKGDSMILTFMENVMEINSEGEVEILSGGSMVSAPSSFEFGPMSCKITTEYRLNCEGLFANIRVQSKDGVTTWYSDLQEMAGGYHFRGLLGNPGDAEAIVPSRMPVNGDAAFLNIYEISKQPDCQVSEQDVAAARRSGACRRAFKRFNDMIDETELHSFISACSDHASSKAEACPYTNMLASILGVEANPEC